MGHRASVVLFLFAWVSFLACMKTMRKQGLSDGCEEVEQSVQGLVS